MAGHHDFNELREEMSPQRRQQNDQAVHDAIIEYASAARPRRQLSPILTALLLAVLLVPLAMLVMGKDGPFFYVVTGGLFRSTFDIRLAGSALDQTNIHKWYIIFTFLSFIALPCNLLLWYFSGPNLPGWVLGVRTSNYRHLVSAAGRPHHAVLVEHPVHQHHGLHAYPTARNCLRCRGLYSHTRISRAGVAQTAHALLINQRSPPTPSPGSRGGRSGCGGRSNCGRRCGTSSDQCPMIRHAWCGGRRQPVP